MSGPALSRLDRLLLIGPRATPTTSLRKLTLSIEAACVVLGVAHSFFSAGPVANVCHSELRDSFFYLHIYLCFSVMYTLVFSAAAN